MILQCLQSHSSFILSLSTKGSDPIYILTSASERFACWDVFREVRFLTFLEISMHPFGLGSSEAPRPNSLFNSRISLVL